MTVTITKHEYDAINEVLEQVRTDYEAATNEDYLKLMGSSITLVESVLNKYNLARQKALEFQQARAYVAERNLNLRLRDIDKLTRRLLKRIEK